MDFDTAMLKAAERSLKEDCSVNVNGRIVLDDCDRPTIDQQGWHTSDWYVTGSTVASFHSGARAL